MWPAQQATRCATSMRMEEQAAIVARVTHDDTHAATLRLTGSGSPAQDLTLEALSAGAWGNRLTAAVDHDTDHAAPQSLFAGDHRTAVQSDGALSAASRSRRVYFRDLWLSFHRS